MGYLENILLEKTLRTDFEGEGFEYAHLGIRGPIKFEIHRLSAHPVEMGMVSMSLGCLMDGRITSVAGVPTGGNPFASRVSSYFGLPEFHIKGKFIEEGYVVGDHPGLIEDATNTGKSGDLARGIVKTHFEVESLVYSVFNYGFRKDVQALVSFNDILTHFSGKERKKLEKWYEKAEGAYERLVKRGAVVQPGEHTRLGVL